jgi:hypothetical protein
MPSRAHEIPVALLSRDPSLLAALAKKLGKPPPAGHRPVDSTVRFADPAEIRPDLILACGKRGPWSAIEVQLRIDHDKGRRWLLLVALLYNERGCMGELWVITASKRTAEWARTACDATGKNGTRVRLEPIVLLIGRDEVDALLDEGRPSLAFFAAWAMQGRRGPEAERVVKRTMELTDRLPARALRQQQRTDIMGVLNGRLAEKLKERVMEAKRSTEPRWVREMREEMFGDQVRALKPKFVAEGRAEGKAEGEAKGKREALLLVLEGRGLSITRPQRGAILACDDLAKLDHWIAASGTAASVAEFLTPAPKKNGARNGAAKHRTARAS